ncbi:MAG: LytR C-terminal domain-containing protein [Dactylosporangium sp.]|nr:LytR C-terminal domain-containing protein [Dactylosporangium sp.]NNJ62139.1 LytR C-terminal domain-containing protein [Dactylosporangium sp.]
MSFARVRALAIVGVLVTCAAILVAVTLFKDRQRGPVNEQSCPKNAVIADVRLPEPRDVKIVFFDATGTSNTAANVRAELRHRQFQVTRSEEPLERTDKVAVLRYGPKAVGSAWLLRAYFLNTAETAFAIERTDDTVDVVLGGGFKKLATATEVGQALAQLGRPQEPSGTCVNERT